jgi:hypothetical protein
MLLLGKSIINGGDWNMAFTFPYYIYIGNFIIPTHDSSSFLQRGGEKPPSQQGTSGIGLKLWPWLQLYYKCISIESKLWFSVCSWFIVALDIIRFCKL